MKKIKILEVNNIDLPGRRFNGYDMIEELDKNIFDIKQAVIIKESDNKNVIKILNNDNLMQAYSVFIDLETQLSIHNVFSITSSSLMNMPEYKEADIIHFHMFHNTKLSLYSLTKIANEKKVIISLHDPWLVTGRCVHFYDCNKWKTGCNSCQRLNNLFSFTKDNCHMMWNLKNEIFNSIDVDLVVSTEWMKNLVESSPITKKQKHLHKIPFGINYEKFNKISYKKAREKYGFDKNERVLFLRAQNEFKGTPYIVEALKEIKTTEKISILTCDNRGLLKEVEDKFKVIDLGNIQDEEMIYAMNACDIFLMPSIGESFGMMALEAMSCSKPVIVFNNSALPSVTHAPECGYLVKDRDSNDLMKAIKYLVENPKECEKRGKLGLKIVKESYTNNVYNKALEELYKTVYNRKHNKVKVLEYEKDLNQINYLKNYLNEITSIYFSNNKKVKKELLYKVTKIHGKDQIDFSNHYINEEIYVYISKLEKYLNEHQSIINSKKETKLRRIINLLISNPKEFISKIKNKIIKK